MLNWYVYVSLIMLIVLLIIGLPIPLVMFGTTLFLVIFGGYSIDMLFPNAYTRLNSMTMVAFPLFIIAGGFIERGGNRRTPGKLRQSAARPRQGWPCNDDVRLLRYFRRDLWLLLCG